MTFFHAGHFSEDSQPVSIFCRPGSQAVSGTMVMKFTSEEVIFVDSSDISQGVCVYTPKTNMSPKKGTISIGNTSSNH